MNGYLMRLVTRAEPAADGARALRPWVASRSPVAEVDQRVSLPGFEAAGLVSHLPAGGGDRGTATTAPRIPTAGPVSEGGGSPLAGIEGAAAGARGSVADSSLRTASPALRSRPELADGGEPGDAPAALSPAAHVSRPPDLRASHRGEQVAGHADGGDAPAVASDAAVRPPTAPHLETGHPSWSSFPAPREEDGRRHAPAVASDATVRPRSSSLPPLVEEGDLRPAHPSAGGSTPAEGEGRLTRAASPAGAGPRLEIGTIEVEVVPPPAVEPRPAPPARPITAESVSQIGPLSAGRRSNLRYALRHR